MFVLIIIIILSFGNLRFEGDNHFYKDLLWIIFGTIDEILWLIGIAFGRKACNDYFLDKLSKMVIFIKISLVFTILNIVFTIMRASMESKIYYINRIITGIVIFIYIILSLVRIYYFIKPGTFLI